ncbi:MAG: glycosyltransferase family 39 protein [Patescibacteria group bacterium]|nr:glycosyltransferase family 39 protein [Patescibacteria group bacterium]
MQKLKNFLKNNWILLVILFAATFLRFYKLDSIPFGLYPDEAANGLDIIRMMEEGDHRVVYDTNGPRESLFFYLQGVFVWAGKAFHIDSLYFTPLALRIAAAIVGTGGVWALYLLAKELFNKKVALFSSAALAVSAWHIQFSRNGFRAIMLPLVLCLIFYYFIKAFREKKKRDYALFGVFLAVGFYTYLSIRMLPFIFLSFWLWTIFFEKGFIKRNIKNILWAAASFTIVMIPMLIHFVHVPADIFGRASTSIFNPELNNGSAIKTLLDNIIQEIKMFNIAGDKNFRHNLGGSPMLDIVTGAIFWIGIVLSALKFKKIEHFLLFAWLGAMSLPMILTAEGIPHALRLVGAIPVIFIWIGLGFSWIYEKIKDKKVSLVVVSSLLLIASFLGFKKYFIDFPVYVEAREAYAEDMYIMGQDLRNSPSDRENLVIAGEFGLKTVQYLTHGNRPKITQFETYEISENFVLPEGKYKIYITAGWYDSAIRALLEKGYWFNFSPVKSDLGGRTLYYEFEN